MVQEFKLVSILLFCPYKLVLRSCIFSLVISRINKKDTCPLVPQLKQRWVIIKYWLDYKYYLVLCKLVNIVPLHETLALFSLSGKQYIGALTYKTQRLILIQHFAIVVWLYTCTFYRVKHSLAAYDYYL